MLGGVCGGLGNYLNVDPIILRIIFILLTLTDGIGFMLYLILWIVMPADETSAETGFEFNDLGDRTRKVGEEFGQAVRNPHPNSVKFIGASLIVAGGYYLLKAFNISWLSWLDNRVILALLLIGGGALLLSRAFRGDR
jgi:phage shock protein C